MRLPVDRLRQVAREHSKQDLVLEEVLLMHLVYNWGKGVNPTEPRIDEAHVVNDVKFWCVGHNASHEFYVGTDGKGKRFRYSVGESCKVDINGDLLEWDNEAGWFKSPPGVDRNFAEVATFSGGYYGHL